MFEVTKSDDPYGAVLFASGSRDEAIEEAKGLAASETDGAFCVWGGATVGPICIAYDQAIYRKDESNE